MNMKNVSSFGRFDPIATSWNLKEAVKALSGIENPQWSPDTGGGGNRMKRTLKSWM